MSIGIALFYFATNMPRLIAIQLFFGLVANAVWPIYYAMASDSAEERATSTANGIITTAMFIGGGISPLLMGWLHSVWRRLGKSSGLYLRLLYHGGMCAAGDVITAHDHR